MHSDMSGVEEAAASDLVLADVTGPRQVSELINSLISSSYTIRCFSGKWQLIRGKLQQLLSNLATTPDGGFCDESSELLAFFESVTLTLRDVDEVLHRCLDESYDGGKLLIKSGLDAVASRLELHNRRLTEIYASGVLTPSQAIVLSKPGIRATREDMRCYVKDVFSRLRIGDSGMRAAALAALHEVLCEDENYVRIVALDVAEGLPLLVSFLEFEDMGIQNGAAAVTAAIAESDAYKGALVAAGAIPLLVQMLERGTTDSGKEKAVGILVRLTKNSDNVWSVSAHGGVTLLLKLCSDPDSSTKLIRSSCNVLRNLSGVEEIKRFMIEEGAIPVLIKLSRSEEEVLQVEAMEFINAMASEDAQIRQIVVKEGVIGSVIQLLDPRLPYSFKAREIAFRATMMFCFGNSVGVLLSSEFLDRVLFFLKNGETCVQESALKVVLHVCEVSEEHRKRLGDVGFLPEIVRLLEAKSYEIRVMAAQILCSLMLVQRNRRNFIKDDNNVNQVMQLLNPEEEKAVPKKLLLSVLMSLTESNSGRKKIVASGHVHYLERLAEANVLDAKKILKKLFGNRLLNILSGLWSY